MSDHETLQHLLGRPGPDAGCDASFDVMDEAAEAQVRGEDLGRSFPGVAAHVRNCAACREDLEGLRAQLLEERQRPTTRSG